MDNIENEINYYKANRLEFIQQYEGKYLAIKGMEVIGVYGSATEAVEETGKLYSRDSYIIEHPLDLSIRRTYIKKK
ncbi:MAG: hypothetical protein H3C54_08960 [Taibaiella sp.]|nr:hypothetical protein [Taibaiella sp.]